MFKLVIEDDEGNKTVVPVIRDEITIGRQEGNTIRLTERNVSRRHARLVRKNGAVVLEELAARYGTRKNGERIQGPAKFDVGDVVTIGDYRLTLQSETKGARAPEHEGGGLAVPSEPSLRDMPTQGNQAVSKEERSSDTQVLPAAAAKMVIVSSNFAGQEFPLTEREVVIGRGEDCDIRIDHRSVSQKHAKVVRETAGTYKIIDLNSKNGVKVSGEQYRAVHLKRGDVVELGHVRFRFVEPGENYVFTPQAATALDDDDFAPTRSNTPIIAGALVVAALAGVGLFWLLAPSQTAQPEPIEASTAAAAATPAANGEAEARAEAVEAPPELEPEPTGQGGEKVDEMLARARSAMEQGEMDKALASLENARDFLEPSPEQRTAIEDLLSQARREKPFAQSYLVGKDHLANENYGDALRAFKEIPPQTSEIIYQKLTREGLDQKALSGAVSRARKAIDEEEWDQARAVLEDALYYAPDHAPALALKKQLEEAQEEAQRQVAALKQRERARQRAATARSERSSPPSRPARTQPDPAKGKALFEESQQKLLKGNWSGAISTCSEGLKHGFGGCHRVLGVAYKNLGKTDDACRHFKAAGIANAGIDCP